MPPCSAIHQQYPLLCALACNNTAKAGKLCTPEEVKKCGPGNLSALMLALLVDAGQLLPRLLAAGAPLNARLSLGTRDGQLSSWLAAVGLGDSRCRKHLQVGRSALDLALLLDKAEQACALVQAGADLDAVLSSRPCCRAVHLQATNATLAYYTIARLQAASPRLLCQVAQLTLLAGRGSTRCLEVLHLAAQRGVAFALEDAEQLLLVAAKRPHRSLEVALWIVQHRPDSVWPLLVDSLHNRGGQCRSSLGSALAAQLFPLLAEQFARGRLTLPEPQDRHMELLLLSALACDQEGTCLCLLRTAGQQQQATIQPSQEFSVLRVAAAQGHAQVTLVLVQAKLDSVWQLLCPEYCEDLTECVHTQVGAALFPYLLQQVQMGELKLAGSAQLALLLQHIVAHKQPATCLALLEAASQRGLQLSAEDESVVSQWAAKQGVPDVVVHLLKAGASVSLEAILAAVDGLSVPCLAKLLQHKPAPQVDRTSLYCKKMIVPWHYRGHWWTCPILRTLQNNSQRNGSCADDEVAVKALCVLEVLLGAGYRPATYRSIAKSGTGPFVMMNPLGNRSAHGFAVKGCNRWLWLALSHEWSPATHHMFPDKLKDSFKTVLLAAAHGLRTPPAQAASGAEPRASAGPRRWSQHRRTAGPAAKAGGGGGVCLLSAFPPEELQQVLRLAASSLSCWVGSGW